MNALATKRKRVRVRTGHYSPVTPRGEIAMAETRTNMSGGDAIVGLPELLKRLNAMRAHLADEADQVAEECAALGGIGMTTGRSCSNVCGRISARFPSSRPGALPSWTASRRIRSVTESNGA